MRPTRFPSPPGTASPPMRARAVYGKAVLRHNLKFAQLDIYPCHERILNFGERVRVLSRRMFPTAKIHCCFIAYRTVIVERGQTRIMNLIGSKNNKDQAHVQFSTR